MKKFLKNHFIPHEGNDYKPHMLQKVALSAMLFLILMSFTISNLQALFLVSSEWFVSTILPAVITDLTNDNREVAALPLLARNTTLDEAARLKAEHMAEHEYFAHDSPGGVTPWHWFEVAGYQYTFAGENLAVHFTDSKAVVDAWMDSPGHRANILDEQYTEIGIGTAQGTYKGFPTVFVVQMFGRPAPQNAVLLAASVDELNKDPEVGSPVPVAVENNPETSEETQSETEATEAVEEPVEANDSEEIETDEAPVKEESVKLAEAANEGGTDFLPEEETSIYSGLATTSRLAALGVVDDVVGAAVEKKESNIFMRILSRPELVLGVVYSLLAGLILVTIILSIVIEWKRQEPIQLAYGVALLLLMVGVLEVHKLLVGGTLII